MAANGQGAVSVSDGGKQLFLSYAREDDVKGFVSKLKLHLEQRGFSVWMDRGDIPAGSDWISRIGSAIQGCSGLVAVITNNYVKSVNGTKELSMAHTSGKKIFPVILEKVNYTQSEEASGVQFIIQNINWVSFQSDVADYKYSNSFTQLVHGLSASGIQPLDGEEATDFVPDDCSPSGLDCEPTPEELEKFVATEVERFNSLGTMLGLKQAHINMIREEEARIVNRNIRILTLWKEKGTRKPITWRTLIKALQDMEMNRLAFDLTEKFGQ